MAQLAPAACYMPIHHGTPAVRVAKCAAFPVLGLATAGQSNLLVVSAVRANQPVTPLQADPPESGVCRGGSSGASGHISRQSDEQQHMAGDS